MHFEKKNDKLNEKKTNKEKTVAPGVNTMHDVYRTEGIPMKNGI